MSSSSSPLPAGERGRGRGAASLPLTPYPSPQRGEGRNMITPASRNPPPDGQVEYDRRDEQNERRQAQPRIAFMITAILIALDRRSLLAVDLLIHLQKRRRVVGAKVLPPRH